MRETWANNTNMQVTYGRMQTDRDLRAKILNSPGFIHTSGNEAATLPSQRDKVEILLAPSAEGTCRNQGACTKEQAVRSF